MIMDFDGNFLFGVENMLYAVISLSNFKSFIELMNLQATDRQL